eukprot:2333052-Alexandrium_andersonii.AAC.1
MDVRCILHALLATWCINALSIRHTDACAACTVPMQTILAILAKKIEHTPGAQAPWAPMLHAIAARTLHMS